MRGSLNFMQQPTMMIVADNEDAKQYRALRLQGTMVETVGINDCIDHIKQTKVDLVLLDCGYRVWTGLSILRQIKQACQNTVVVFLTDLDSEDFAIKAFIEGAEVYFKKPVNLSELQQALERVIMVKQAPGTFQSRVVVRSQEDSVSCLKTIPAGKPQNLLQVIAFIEKNLLSSMELESLAERAHLSKFHFCRVFKRYIGMNPMKFVAALRIERAKELLKENNKAVSLVASEAGFRDLSNFIRQFKKITGVTPTMYRGYWNRESPN